MKNPLCLLSGRPEVQEKLGINVEDHVGVVLSTALLVLVAPARRPDGNAGKERQETEKRRVSRRSEFARKGSVNGRKKPGPKGEQKDE